ncbi:choice-of-anchor B family protein [uncultured Polaribacter sp.]|uniref:choice-of-anchor B family protein n=1 Tax=uncultured Polaribacter sp. TaxID=174711 RepID=UPI002629840B|nr:choice-of-anchor B family protein [uncultured Polaribacter sp.]
MWFNKLYHPIKNTSYVLTLVFLVNCSKKDVFESGEQIIITPMAECINGFAGEYPCNDYDLLTHISLEEIGAEKGNDCWGWTDPETLKEYALMCTNSGVTFVDITDPAKSIILGTLKTKTENSPWRDIKVYNSIAYIVSEAPNHGMQLFNLIGLRNVVNPPIEFTEDAFYGEFGNAHNLVINEDTGYAYAVGTSTFDGGPHFVDLNSPFNPIPAGGFAEGTYSHDAQVVTYNGPDTDYTNREILIGSNETEIVIVDVTDKENPTAISSVTYPNIGYSHQGWFTEDFRYFLLGDELDEQNFGGNTRTIIFDLTDLDNPTFHFDYFGETEAIDHNGYVKGDLFFQASYTNGVRIIDISQIRSKSFTEVGFFDTHPENNSTLFDGAWNVYPFFPSGNIIVSDIDRGLFVIRKSKS